MPQRAFNYMSERIEWLMSRWWGASAYFALCALTLVLWGWDGIDRLVYLTGAVLLVLLIGAGRRDSKAVHAKLDDIDERDDMNRIEERSEEEIEAKRAPVPGVYGPGQGNA